MSHIHVCLVSEQTIPNILSIYHFDPEEVLFVSTEKMESLKIVAHINNALSMLNKNYKNEKIIVKEDALLDCKKKLDEWISGREGAEFTVNLTGGTKIMSIAAYEYFKDYGSKMGYIPIGKNEYITIFPKKSFNTVEQLKERLPVSAYLMAYGLKVTNHNKLIKNHNEAISRKDLSKWIVEHYQDLKPLLERFNGKLRNYRNEKNGFLLKTSYTPEKSVEIEFFEKLGFQKNGNEYNKHFNQSEIIYITGGWLEEFCYTQLLEFKGRGIDDIVTGITLKKNGNYNEFDVMLTKDNALFTIECKSLDQSNDTGAEALYKIAALQKVFGLRVESFFVSTSPHILKDGKIKPSIEARAEQFKTTIILPQEVINFSQIIARKLKINI